VGAELAVVSIRSEPSDISSALISPLRPQVIVLFGARGELARRELLPGSSRV